MWPFNKCKHEQVGRIDLIIKTPLENYVNNINTIEAFLISSKCKICGKSYTGWTIHRLSTKKIDKFTVIEIV